MKRNLLTKLSGIGFAAMFAVVLASAQDHKWSERTWSTTFASHQRACEFALNQF